MGAARLSAFSVLIEMLGCPPIKSATAEERRRAVDERGIIGALSWGDIFFDIDANRMATELYGEAIARIVDDPRPRRPWCPATPLAANARSSTRATTRRSTGTTSPWSTCAPIRSER